MILVSIANRALTMSDIKGSEMKGFEKRLSVSIAFDLLLSESLTPAMSACQTARFLLESESHFQLLDNEYNDFNGRIHRY